MVWSSSLYFRLSGKSQIGSGAITEVDFDNVYQNIGTVTANGLEDSDPSSYINPAPVLTEENLITVTESDVNETPGDTPLRLEAEDADTIINYRKEDIGVASEGKALSFRGGSKNEIGSATFSFNEAPGNYNIVVGTFDENDGLAQFTLELNDAETNLTTQIGTLNLFDNRGSNVPNAQTLIAPTVAFGVALTPGNPSR